MKNTFSCASQNFSFDELAMLAATDQGKFEALRLVLIESAINSPGGNPDQLTALQSRLDEKSETDTPRYLACLKLSDWLEEPYQKLAHRLKAAQRSELHCLSATEISRISCP